ncbi:serine protease [Thalassotalea euphylliae]|uniref:Serine protease n=1 Tax=Thalassotalea euphylliae TaxID=1655234 RepID=A0A3E0TX54_9GAMM|nr:serine protease [Thalassotalea euphylliae]REL28555.1 serine protease [Thalassotalea euphylliae]
MRILTSLIALFLLVNTAYGHDMVSLVKKVKPSVVGIGVYTPLGNPKNELRGTGFVIGNGHYVATNHHVLPEVLDPERLQEMVVFVGVGRDAKARKATIVGSSRYHDLAILKIEGERLPAMSLAGDDFYPEGSEVGFTGFPIGAILGLFPVTHKAMLASITPVVIPVKDTREMSITMLKRLRDPYMVYQLDGTAYPGNSGSALYDETGKVIGVINKVFVQSTKEAVISNPSGITYAIPVRHLRKLMRDNQVSE